MSSLLRQVVQAAVLACVATGCATRSSEVMSQKTDPAEFAAWTCERIDEESDRVQLRAADVAYAVDERFGNNMIALGFGVTLFWPAVLAMRPNGIEAQELAALKGRYEALRTVLADPHFLRANLLFTLGEVRLRDLEVVLRALEQRFTPRACSCYAVEPGCKPGRRFERAEQIRFRCPGQEASGQAA